MLPDHGVGRSHLAPRQGCQDRRAGGSFGGPRHAHRDAAAPTLPAPADDLRPVVGEAGPSDRATRAGSRKSSKARPRSPTRASQIETARNALHQSGPCLPICRAMSAGLSRTPVTAPARIVAGRYARLPKTATRCSTCHRCNGASFAPCAPSTVAVRARRSFRPRPGEGDCARQGQLCDAGPCRRPQVGSSPTALPSGGDDGGAGHRYRPLNAGRLGWTGSTSARPHRHPHSRRRAQG